MDYIALEKLSVEEKSVELVRSVVIRLDPLQIMRGVQASRAASCLLEPRLGDAVLCMVLDGQAVILSIIDRLEPELASVIDSTTPLEIRSSEINLISQKVGIEAEHLNINVSVMRRIVDRLDDVIQYFSSSVETIFIHAKRSIKRVDELDETRAGHLRLESPTLVEMHGAVTAVSGEELIKLQGKQIHMG